MGREARVIPSIDKRGYVVQPYSSVQVRVVTKGGPITLTGEDVETESRLLLNNSSSPITVTPSDTPDIITDISITAEGIVYARMRVEKLGIGVRVLLLNSSFQTKMKGSTS